MLQVNEINIISNGSDQIRTDQIRTDQIRTDQIRTDQSEWIKLLEAYRIC